MIDLGCCASEEIRANLGSAYYKLGYTEKAFIEWEEALKLNPNNSVLKSIVETVKRQKKVMSQLT